MEIRQKQSLVSWLALVFVIWALGLLSLFWILDPTKTILIQEGLALPSLAPVWGSTGLVTTVGGLLLGSLIVISWLGFGTHLLVYFPRTAKQI